MDSVFQELLHGAAGDVLALVIYGVCQVVVMALVSNGMVEASLETDPSRRNQRVALEYLASLAVLLAVTGLLLPLVLPDGQEPRLRFWRIAADLFFPVGVTVWVAVGLAAQHVIHDEAEPEPEPQQQMVRNG